MGFWRAVRRKLRSEIVVLDAEQARLILSLAREGARHRPPRPTPEGRGAVSEREVLERFEKRCRELG